MANAFSLTQLVVITLDANGEARFGATLTGNSGARGLTQQVPDAGSSLVLLGTGVIVVELLRRRVARSFAI